LCLNIIFLRRLAMTHHDESLHDMRMITNDHWKTFFGDLAQKYQGQPVSFELGEDLLLDNPPADEVPLLGIEYGKHKGVVITAGSGAETQKYVVKALDLVWAIHDEQGTLVAVEIIAEDGRNLILRLEP
jgi:hypothetical protein